MQEHQKNELISIYKNHHADFNYLLGVVANYFTNHPTGKNGVHTVKSRIKSENSLIDKIDRKEKKGILVTAENFFQEITDIAGLRILHLRSSDFVSIHNSILSMEKSGHWHFCEPPIAYSWDPEAIKRFEDLNINTVNNERHYTSVHYRIKDNANSNISCEIQVRTLFEEAWGEIDHAINYPHQSSVQSCKDQILVLAKLVGASTRLIDSIYSAHENGAGNV